MQAVRQVRHVTPDSLARAGLERADDPTSLYSESTGLLVLPWSSWHACSHTESLQQRGRGGRAGGSRREEAVEARMNNEGRNDVGEHVRSRENGSKLCT